MFQLAILQNALPSGAGYSIMVILLGAFSGALVAVFQTLFARAAARRGQAEEAPEPRAAPGVVVTPGPATHTG